jgi:UDP-glucose 4-epimerase
VPKVASARTLDIVTALLDGRAIKTEITGVRPGEKIHEVLISEEEAHRTNDAGNYFVIEPIIPELRRRQVSHALDGEYSSASSPLSINKVKKILQKNGLLLP